MPAFDAIDGWFEKGFRVRRQKGAKTAQRDAARSRSGSRPASTGSVKFSAGAKAKNIKSVVRKAPEVMVKITGHSKGLATVRHHLDYVSRNGEVELVNERGESVSGRTEVKGLLQELRAAQIPDEGRKREFLHVMFSMPKGTPEKGVRAAVADFAREEFANRRYVMAFHNDTDHVHVHVVVGTRDIDRADEPRLSPRKDDLFRWRQGFADKLRENGIDAAASERRHRFNHRRAEHSIVRQIQAADPLSPAFNDGRARDLALTRSMKASMRPATAFVGPPRPPSRSTVVEARQTALRAALAAGARPVNPAQERMEATRAATLAGWRRVAEELGRSGDVAMANEVLALLDKGGRPVRSADQERYDVARASRNRDASQSL